MDLSILNSLIEDLPFTFEETPIHEKQKPASPYTPLESINSEASESVYRPILGTQIRLIQIHPGELNDIVCCSLEIAERAASPAYQVLSYVWGSQADPETISLQGNDWRVTRSLAALLRRLRETSSNQPIWIDALCINQSDILERNEQVSQMRYVYSSASLTILWLGTGEDDAIKKLLEIIAFFFLCWGSEYGSLTIRLPRRPAVCFLTAMHAIARQEYWQRAWVAQEIMFSKNVWLTYGSSGIPYDFFSRIWNLLCTSLMQMHRQISSAWPRWRSFSILARVINGGPNALPDVGSGLRGDFINLEQWARTGASKRSTDHRDVVFAYHGCFAPHIRDAFEIDYNRSLREVVTTMTRLYLQTTGSLNTILNAVRNPVNQDLPSWVPIGQPADASPLNVSLWNSPRRNASGSKPAQFTFLDTISAIRVKGVKIGVVSRAAPRMSYDFDALEKWIEYGDVYDDTRHSFKQALEGLQVSLHSIHPLSLIEAFLDVMPDSPLLEDFKDWWYGISSNGIPLEFQQNMLDIGMGHSPQLRGYWFEQKRNMTTEFWQRLMDTSLLHSPKFEDKDQDGRIEALPGFETPLYKRLCDLPLLHNNRRMFSYKFKDSARDSDDGYGLGGDRLEPGDTVCVILGCSTPVVLRQEEEHYRLVADAVMPRLMSGEAVHETEYDVEEFVIE